MGVANVCGSNYCGIVCYHCVMIMEFVWKYARCYNWLINSIIAITLMVFLSSLLFENCPLDSSGAVANLPRWFERGEAHRNLKVGDAISSLWIVICLYGVLDMRYNGLYAIGAVVILGYSKYLWLIYLMLEYFHALPWWVLRSHQVLSIVMINGCLLLYHYRQSVWFRKTTYIIISIVCLREK